MISRTTPFYKQCRHILRVHDYMRILRFHMVIALIVTLQTFYPLVPLDFRYPIAIILALILIFYHRFAKKFITYNGSIKSISKESQYTNLKSWMVYEGDKELNEDQYQELIEGTYSKAGYEKLELLKKKDTITVYDAVNLIIFDVAITLYPNKRTDD